MSHIHTFDVPISYKLYIFINSKIVKKVEKSGKILVVDDNKSILDSLGLFLKHRFKEVVTLSNPNEILAHLDSDDFDVVLLDMNFSASQHTGNEGIYWMRRIKKSKPDISIVPITAYGDVEHAVLTMKEGATDYILKPWENNKLLATLQAAFQLKRSRDELNKLRLKQSFFKEEKDQAYSKLLWKSGSMQKVYDTIGKVAPTDANILIQGENGTGKELAAYAVHKRSKRKHEVFVRVDLGALSESLFESEMFGHRKGSFTDAKTDRTGKMASASGGTLMLDEISNLSLPMQSKLLTSLQSKKIVPVGSNREVAVNFRLICASNKILEDLAVNNLFREDLLYRVNTILIEIPPLRRRPEDIEFLATHFLKTYGEKYTKQNLRIDKNAIWKLANYSWPGNVRELKHTIEKAVILSDSDILTAEDFPFRIKEFDQTLNTQPLSLEEGEKIMIQKALGNNRGNISETAKELKIGRQTLYRKIEKFNIKF